MYLSKNTRATKRQLTSNKNVITNTCYQYLLLGLVLVVIHPFSKRPIPHPSTHSWWKIRSIAEMRTLLYKCPNPNIALLTEDIVQVDCDSKVSIGWCRSTKLFSKKTWILRTARGFRLFFKAPDSHLKTQTDPSHKRPDFLAPGSLAIVPPSVHQSGYPYTWLRNCSPLEISIADLVDLPGEVLSIWQELQKDSRSFEYDQVRNTPEWLILVFQSVISYLSNNGHKLRSTNDAGFITTCPFHNDHNPSFSLHPIKGWKCFAGCGQGRITLLAAKLRLRV